MKADDPKHGTSAQTWQAVAGCVCDACEQTRARRRRNYKLRKQGRGPTIATGKVVTHLRRLMAAGWTQTEISKASGVSQVTLSEARRGHAKRMTAAHAVAILSLDPDDAPRGHSSQSIGAIRRIQALARLGYTVREVCRAAGLHERYMAELIDKNRTTCSTTAALAIEDVYRRLHMTPPPMTPHRKRTKTIAISRGWLPPLAYDDIDDPNGGLGTATTNAADPIVVARIMSGEWRMKANPAERIEVITRWIELGYSQNEIGRRTGWNVDRDLKLHGHRDAA